MVQTHQDSCEEGTTTPFPHQETENIWHGSPDPQKVLQLHHQEHPERLHYSASDRKVLQRVVCTAQYITGTKLPDIQDLYTRRCQEGPKNCQNSQSPKSETVLSATARQAESEQQV